MAVDEQFKIKLNQNIWGLIVGYAAVGAAEYYKLRALYCMSTIVASALSLSVIITVGFYTYRYCKDKLS